MKSKRLHRGSPESSPNSMELLLDAITKDDQSSVEALLKANPSLAIQLITTPRLYESKILHWIYAGDTALHLAAAGHRPEITRLLLMAGADPNSIINHRKSSPLHYAADGCLNGPDWNEQQQVKTVQYLLKAGAKVNIQDKNGASPLHRAVRTRCAAAVKFLLDSGGDAMLRNKPGSTPFHLAVQNTGRGGSGAAVAKVAQERIINEFLARGVKPSLKDAKGKSVFDSAKSGAVRSKFQPPLR